VTHSSFTFESSTAVVPNLFAVSTECGHLLDFVVRVPSTRELFQTKTF